MADESVKGKAHKFANNVGRAVSIVGAASVLVGGCVLLFGPDTVLDDAFVWDIPLIGQPLKAFWQLGYKGITNQRIVGAGLTIIGLHYFKLPHAVAWALRPIPLVGGVVDRGLEWYLTVFQYVENIFIPRLTIEDSIYNTKEWQRNYEEWEREYADIRRRSKGRKVEGGTTIFIPDKPTEAAV